MNYTRILVFVKIISYIISLRTNFHQFATSYDDVHLDLLDNVLHNHIEEIFFSKNECLLLMKSRWDVALYPNEQCIPLSQKDVVYNSVFFY